MSDIVQKDEETQEMIEDTYRNPDTVFSFSDLEKVDHSADALEKLTELHSIANAMLWNISNFAPDKLAAAEKLITEYADMAKMCIDEARNAQGMMDGEDNGEKEKRLSRWEKVKALAGIFKKKEKKPQTIIPVVTKEKSFYVWKDQSTGQWRWLANYSNHFRDNDNPPQIISSESHKRFEEMVDKGLTAYPELWHWHVKGSKWGQSDWVAYDEDNGIAMAAGYILEGHEKEAMALAEADIEIGVSHGMPAESIKLDEKSQVIDEHITVEISDLPLQAAANKLTSFYVFEKEQKEMAIPGRKKAYMRDTLHMSEDEIAAIESSNKGLSEAAQDAQIESKESDAEERNENVSAETEVNETQVAQFVTAEQFAEAVAAITKSVSDALADLTGQVALLQGEVKDVREAKEKESTDPRAIPSASIAALIAEQMRAVGSKEAQVTRRETISKEGPEETSSEPTQKYSSNPLLNDVIHNIIGGKK
jgi:hypothetical protein